MSPSDGSAAVKPSIWPPNGRDLVVNVLEGTGEVRADGSPIAVSAGSAILLIGDDTAVLAATTDLRFIEGRATGWKPHSDATR